MTSNFAITTKEKNREHRETEKGMEHSAGQDTSGRNFTGRVYEAARFIGQSAGA